MTTIQCHHCSKVYRVPVERLPQGKRLSIPCPNCGGRIVFSTENPHPPLQSAAPDPSKDPQALKERILGSERRLFGFDHADIASEVCGRWNIPEALSTAIGNHHTPSRSSDDLAYILNLADHIARTGGMGYGDDDFLYLMASGTAERLNLTQEVVTEISSKVIETVLGLEL